MILISLHVPEVYLEVIDEMVESGVFPDRSSVIRYAIRYFIFTKGIEIVQEAREREMDAKYHIASKKIRCEDQGLSPEDFRRLHSDTDIREE